MLRDRVPLAARRAIWRTGRWHRERKPLHHPAKRQLLKILLHSHLELDFCIEREAKALNINVRTLRSWIRMLQSRGAIDVIDQGYGRRAGLRLVCRRSKLYELISELDQGERLLIDRRRRRHGFSWAKPEAKANKRKPDRSPIPLSERREKDLLPIGSTMNSVLGPIRFGRRPSATRSERAPDALRAAIRGEDGQKNEPRGENLSRNPALQARCGRSQPEPGEFQKNCDHGGKARGSDPEPQTKGRASPLVAATGFQAIYAAIDKAEANIKLSTKHD